MRTSVFILGTVLLALPMRGQTTTGTSPHAHPDNAHRHVRAAVKPSALTRPAARTRRSTAEGAAVRGQRPPLVELPTFDVHTRDGLSVSAHSLSRKGHWLLLYRMDKCVPCDRLMNVLAAGASAEPGSGQSYTIVVAGHQHDGLDQVRAAYANFANATWLSDAQNKAFGALKAHGTPVLYGMDGSRIAWRIPGSVGDPSLVDQRAADWVTRSNPAAPAAVAPASAAGAGK